MIRQVIPLSFAIGVCLAGSAFAMTDKEFIAQAIQGDNAEVEMGRLALQKTSDASVKSFARTLIDDHSKHKSEAAAVAKQVGVAPPADAPPEAKAEYDKLKTLSASNFDKEFATFMVTDHEKDIADYKSEAGSGHGAVQALASKTVPTLEKHLNLAKALQAKL